MIDIASLTREPLKLYILLFRLLIPSEIQFEAHQRQHGPSKIGQLASETHTGAYPMSSASVGRDWGSHRAQGTSSARCTAVLPLDPVKTVFYQTQGMNLVVRVNNQIMHLGQIATTLKIDEQVLYPGQFVQQIRDDRLQTIFGIFLIVQGASMALRRRRR